MSGSHDVCTPSSADNEEVSTTPGGLHEDASSWGHNGMGAMSSHQRLYSSNPSQLEKQHKVPSPDNGKEPAFTTCRH